jgi:hypothetical protein
VLVVDAGTTAVKAALLGPGGATLATVSVELVDGLSEVGELSRAAAEELELPAGLPLVHAAGDAASVPAGLIGATPGAISVSLGTSGWVAALTGRPSAPVHDPLAPTGRRRVHSACRYRRRWQTRWTRSRCSTRVTSASTTTGWPRRTANSGRCCGPPFRALAGR